MHPALLLAGYLLLAAAPVLLAAAQGLPPRPLGDEIATALGLVAFAVILMEFVLSGRFPSVSGRIGMDVTMRFHQRMARVAVLFLLVHPFLYRTPFALDPRPWDATGRETLALDGATLASGVAAWVLLAVLVATAIFRDRLPYRYETWRIGHGLAAVAVAGLGAHHALAAGRYSADPGLAALWAAMLAVAAASLAWVYVGKPLLQRAAPWSVRSVRPIAERCWELVIEPASDRPFTFLPGQFVWLNLGRSPFSLAENPFSIASAPADRDRLEFVVKEVGDMTRRVGAVAPGTRAYIDGPHGGLVLRGDDGTGVAMIAGGVGIAPFLSMLRQFDRDGDRRRLVLVYGNRAESQIVYREELAALAGRLSLRVEHVLSEPPPGWKGATGVIDGGTVDRLLDAWGADTGWRFVLCGPPAMIDSAERALRARGVHRRRILAERFSYD